MSLRTYREFISEILPSFGRFDVRDKERNTALIVQTFLDRLQSMFEYKGLPETIPQKYLEIYLQCNGSCIIADVKGSLYALVGALSDVPDAYYLPTRYVVANPYLKLSKTYTIEPGKAQDAAFIRNDCFMTGTLPLIKKYASLMAENELSMNISVINSRIMSLISADTDAAFESAKKYMDDIEAGKLGAVASDPFFEGIKSQPYATGSHSMALTSLIEYEQYLKASLYNELGLNANYNMKRESINSNESQLNDDMLTPLIDNMLECRREGLEIVNKLFGTDITVEFNSAWKENEIVSGLELKNMEETDGETPEAPEEIKEEVRENE